MRKRHLNFFGAARLNRACDGSMGEFGESLCETFWRAFGGIFLINIDDLLKFCSFLVLSRFHFQEFIGRSCGSLIL